MAKPSVRFLGVAAVAAVALAGVLGLQIVRSKSPPPVELFGNVEARDVPVSFRQGGRIARILVEEGAKVQAGQVIAMLDTATLYDALAAANAEVMVAQAELARIAAPSRPQEVAQAALGVQQAQAALLQNAALLNQNSATLRQASASVAQTQAALRQADAALQQANAVLTSAETDFQRQESLVGDGSVSTRTRDLARERRDVARAGRDAALAQRDTAAAAATSAEAQRDGVAAQRAATLGAKEGLQAGLSVTRQTLSLRQEGARSVDVLSGQARVSAAQANRQRATRALADATLLAPNKGVVLARLQEPGALVQAGAPIISLGLGAPVYIRAYVSAEQLGRVAPGTAVEVRSDSSDAVWAGQVGFVSPRAEFTPKTVETEDLRTDLVYRIRIIVPGDGAKGGAALLPGMPVTIRLTTQTAQ